MDERRYYGLDALRGGMMMLGIVLHAALLYMAAPPVDMPIPTDRNNAYTFDVLFHFIHSFRMPTFFVLAGFFTSLLLEKRGLWGTYKNRGARVLAPLVAAIVVILPVTGLFMLDFMLSARFGTHDIWPKLAQVQLFAHELGQKLGHPVDSVSLGHLWFLYYLCLFYLGIPAYRWLARQSLRFEAGVKKSMASPAVPLLLGCLTAATLWTFPGGQVHDSFMYLKPHVPSLIYYGSFFLLGYIFQGYREWLESARRWLPWSAALSLVLFPLSLYLTALDLAAMPQAVGPHAMEAYAFGPHLAATLAHGLCTWALIYFCFGFALRYFDFASPWTLYYSQSSYWVFLIHMPLVALAGWWLVQFDLPAIFKFLCVVGFTMLISLVTYHYAVQKTWVSVFLNGQRFNLNWPWQSSGAN